MKHLLSSLLCLLLIASCKDKQTNSGAEKKVTSVAIAPDNPSVAVGRNIRLTATATPADASQAVTWTSSDTAKATINATTGTATGIAIGTVTITAAAADGSGVAGTTALTVRNRSADASVSAIALGGENFIVSVPSDGAAVVLANAPRSIASHLKAIKVNITAAANASVKIGAAVFVNGNTIDFTSPVTFTVTAEDGTTAKNYTLGITPYAAASNPYGIYTVKHLVDVANALDKNFLLKNNIDLPDANAAGAAAAGIKDYASAGWLPLDSLTGTFDGGNFSINNFYVRRETVKAGLFPTLGTTSVIKNLGVNGVSGTAAAGSNNNDKQYTGMLAGYSSGTIEKCHATGNVSSSSVAGGLVGYNHKGAVSHSHAAGNVASFSSYAGGLAGRNSGAISNSYATGTVSSSSSSASDVTFAGGLAGYNSGAISDSYATGAASSHSSSSNSAAGGLTGVSVRGGISNSYATGTVSSSSSGARSNSTAGGLAGINVLGHISNSYATGAVSSSSSNFSFAGGLAGHSSGAISNSYATGTAFSISVASSYAGGLAGYNSNGNIRNSYSAGSVYSSSDSEAYAGGLTGAGTEGMAHANCYRNSDAAITKKDQAVPPDDAAIVGITPKTKADMQKDAFKGNLNGTSNTWGRSDSKNNKLPFIIGVGVGK